MLLTERATTLRAGGVADVVRDRCARRSATARVGRHGHIEPDHEARVYVAAPCLPVQSTPRGSHAPGRAQPQDARVRADATAGHRPFGALATLGMPRALGARHAR